MVNRIMLCVAIFFVPVLNSGAEELAPGRYIPDYVRKDLVEFFVGHFGIKDSAVTDTSLESLLPRPKEDIGQLALKKKYWSGSIIEADGALNVELTWAHPDSSKPSTKVLVDFEPTAILIRLSDPFSKNYLGGFRIGWREKNRKILFLEGTRRRSFIAIIPPKVEGSIWSVLLCPRHFDEQGNEYEVSTLRDTGYIPTGALFNAKAKASGKFTSVGFAAFAESRIMVGEPLSISMPFEDVARTADPSVSVFYAPVDSQGVQDLAGKLSPGFVTGVRSYAKLVTPVGHDRKLDFESRIQIQSQNLEKENFVSMGGIDYPIETGLCYQITRFDESFEVLTEAQSVKSE